MLADPLADWDGEPVERLRERWGVPALEVHEQVDSTNDLARERAAAGARAGSVIVALEQRAGRGRRGRPWTAPAGSSLLLSMVMPPAAAGGASVVSLRLGLAAARALEDTAPVRVGLKWPNDLLIAGRKVAGILCEGGLDAGSPLYLIAGIGINLFQRDDDWPPELRGSATSLRAASGAAVHPATLAGRLVGGWLAAAELDPRALSAAEVREYARRDILRGRPVTVDGVPAGTARGVAPGGALLVETEGAARHVVAGTVRPLDDPEGAAG